MPTSKELDLQRSKEVKELLEAVKQLEVKIDLVLSLLVEEEE